MLSENQANILQSSQQSGNEKWLLRRNQAVPIGVAHAAPIFAARAKNAELWDIEGVRYIDFAGGIAVLNTGHVHPHITRAVERQINLFSHVAFQVMPYQSYVELAEKLNSLAPGDFAKKSVFFSSGAEAVENAIKIARNYTTRSAVIAFSGGFHGRSMMTMSLTGKVDPYKKGFGDLPGNVYHAPFPITHHGISLEDAINAIERIFKTDVDAKNVAAIILEPVQGEGGFYQAPVELMQYLRDVCDKYGILLIADEVQSGIGRTGKLFAMEHYPVHADLITTAKSLASGYPLSGVIGKAEIMDAVQPGGLGGTYGGNPVACAAALAVLEVIDKENLLNRSQQLGETFSHFMHNVKAHDKTGSKIGNIRHVGAMAAFELVDEDGKPDARAAKKLTQTALQSGLVLLSCGIYGNTIRILVPLTVTDTVFQEGLQVIRDCLKKI